MTSAEELKAKGNTALQAGNISEAIEFYTQAINTDGTNHVYYSNRSAAYLKQGNAFNALEDANSCLGLNPKNYAKGYSRKGAALHAMKRLNDSIRAYEDGLKLFPSDPGLIKGLEQVKRDRDGPPPSTTTPFGMGGGNTGNPMANLFGPDIIPRIAMNPKLRHYLSDNDFMEKIKLLQKDPNQLTNMLGDERILNVFQAMLGVDIQTPSTEMKDDEYKSDDMMKSGEDTASSPSKPTATAAVTKEEEKAEQKKEEEDTSDLTEEEIETQKKKKESIAAKERGNDLYKSKKFDDALSAYDEAILLDPTNMTFHSNKAAVYFTTKQYKDCITACMKAVDIGKANRAPFEDRAKAYTRCAKAYQKMGDLAMAIEMCQSAQLESYDKATERLMKTMELEKKKADAIMYQDDDKAMEAKERGNEHFRAKEWAMAVKEYEEAVKRAPSNASIRNNLSAALCKIMDFNGAKTQIEKAIELDDSYVKAWARKGDIEVVMKENHKAMESYRKGLELDPNNVTCRDGLRKVQMMINAGATNMTEEEKRERAEHALADPEIQAILQDPVMNQVLKDFGENPQAAQQAMMDASVRGKIEKLIAAGVVQTG